MKGTRFPRTARRAFEGLLVVSLVLTALVAAHAQTPATEDAMQNRLARARAQAVIGNFSAAAEDLRAISAESKDEAVRDVARILLMSVYLRQSNYLRASELLDETFKGRSRQDESSARVYFALAGQILNGVRSRLDRYREFGLNVVGDDLPVEARADIDQLRRLLEKTVEQARSIRAENNQRGDKPGNMDVAALVEDASSVRLALSLDEQDRARWQREMADARQQLVSDTRIASISDAPVTRAPVVAAAAPAGNRTTTDAAKSSTPRNTPAAQNRTPTPASNVTSSAYAPARESATAPASKAAGTGNAASDSAPGNPVSVGSLLDRAMQKIAPTYPATAKAARVSGIVTVHVVVNEKGAVEAVRSASGPVLLQQAASDAAKRWKFRPTVIDGQPVRVSGFISFNFAL